MKGSACFQLFIPRRNQGKASPVVRSAGKMREVSRADVAFAEKSSAQAGKPHCLMYHSYLGDQAGERAKYSASAPASGAILLQAELAAGVRLIRSLMGIIRRDVYMIVSPVGDHEGCLCA